MERRSPRRAIASWVWLVLLIAPLVFLHFTPMGRATTIGLELRNLGHIPLFACVTLALLQLLSRPDRSIRARYAWAIGISIFLGITSEALQIPLRRDADPQDLGRDVIGVALAVLFSRWVWERTRKRRQGVLLFMLVTLVVIAVTAWPLYQAIGAVQSRSRAFPTLFDFEHEWQRYYIDSVGTGVLWRESPKSWERPESSTAARIFFGNLRFPRVTFDELHPDWTEYDLLAFELFSEQPHAVKITLTIDDAKHDFQWADRYNRRLHIAPGRNEIRIPLEEVRLGPGARELDLRSIVSMSLYFSNPHETRVLWIDDVRLERTVD
ncbi:MAG: hypothetical protein OEV00_01675 [Acidobacteriota bacterium]|nr:hypothetical protein [Acidobacteriota bacterium]MDH3784017.1 hypothetical protein [Acidobacteriota bacterium]